MEYEKRILILGASGTVGRKIAQVLSSEKTWKVTGTFHLAAQSANPSRQRANHTRPGERVGENTRACGDAHLAENNFQTHSGGGADRCEMMQFSLEQKGRLEEILEQTQPDVIVSALRGDYELLLETHRKAAAYLNCRRGRMIFLSSANVFDGKTDTVHYEDDTPGSVSEYGNYKIACERLLTEWLGARLSILRLPFVWGQDSPRIRQVREGCRAGRLEVFQGLRSNHAADLQIADYVRWVIGNEKGGIFHVGTSEVTEYLWFIGQMMEGTGWNRPKFVCTETSQTMAVLTAREDLPAFLKWTTRNLLEYLCGQRTTPIGIVRMSRRLPYPCTPEQEIIEESGTVRRIITAAHCFRLHLPLSNGTTEGTEIQEITPVVYQSCMHPEQIRIYPVELEFSEEEILFQVRDQQWKIAADQADSVEILDWEAKVEKKSCIPCTNCGRCSW